MIVNKPTNKQIVQAVECGVDNLKFLGIDSSIADKLRAGEVFCTDGGDLIQDGVDIYNAYLSKPTLPPRRLSNIEQEIVALTNGYVYNKETQKWENKTDAHSFLLPIYCIRSKRVCGDYLEIISIFIEDNAEGYIDRVKNNTFIASLTVVDINKYLSRTSNGNTKDWSDTTTALLWLDRGRIIRVL